MRILDIGFTGNHTPIGPAIVGADTDWDAPVPGVVAADSDIGSVKPADKIDITLLRGLDNRTHIIGWAQPFLDMSGSDFCRSLLLYKEMLRKQGMYSLLVGSDANGCNIKGHEESLAREREHAIRDIDLERRGLLSIPLASMVPAWQLRSFSIYIEDGGRCDFANLFTGEGSGEDADLTTGEKFVVRTVLSLPLYRGPPLSPSSTDSDPLFGKTGCELLVNASGVVVDMGAAAWAVGFRHGDSIVSVDGGAPAQSDVCSWCPKEGLFVFSVSSLFGAVNIEVESIMHISERGGRPTSPATIYQHFFLCDPEHVLKSAAGETGMRKSWLFFSRATNDRVVHIKANLIC